MTQTDHLLLDEKARRDFAEKFPHHPFKICHNLVGHPLLSLARLAKLSDDLPPRLIEHNSGQLPISQDPSLTPGNGLSVRETIDRIDSSGSWVALKYVELDSDYRQLLIDCVHDIVPLSEKNAPGAHQLEGYVFISSPDSVTPYHFDDEHNFLFQIAGAKEVHVWDSSDLDVISHLDLERYYNGAHRNLVFNTKLDSRRSSYQLTPGQGLHIPVHCPHWVKNGKEASVSFSVTFRSERLRREAAVHWLNGKLRANGLSPRPYGSSGIRDRLKFYTTRIARRIRRGS